MEDTYEFLNEKLIIFCKLNIKDGNVFYTDIYYIYIYDNNTTKIFTWSYIKKVLKNIYASLIKLSATTKQLGCLKNQAIFSQGEHKDPLPPSTTNSLLKRLC